MIVTRTRGGTLILGGGFAGVTVARELGRRSSTLVSPNPVMAYTPLLPEVASGELQPEHAVFPLRLMCPHADVVLGTAVGLDARRRRVRIIAESHAVDFEYDHLVVAVGAESRWPAIPGLVDHGFGAKSPDDFLRLRDRVLRELEAAAREMDPARRLRHLTFVFVGGGYAGVETLAELQRLARDAARNYACLGGVAQRWVLVDAAPQILSDIPGRLGAYAARDLERRGVEIRTSIELESLEQGRAVFSDGNVLETNTLVWTAGVTPSALVEELGLPLDASGRIRVEPTLRVEGFKNIWAAGDCAAVPNEATPGQHDPPTSQHAQRQARRVAKNIAAAYEKRPIEPYRYSTLGQVATLGRYHGMASVLGIPLSGLAGWLAARSVHLLELPDALGRLAVASDWTLSLLYRRDTSISQAEDGSPPTQVERSRLTGYPYLGTMFINRTERRDMPRSTSLVRSAQERYVKARELGKTPVAQQLQLWLAGIDRVRSRVPYPRQTLASQIPGVKNVVQRSFGFAEKVVAAQKELVLAGVEAVATLLEQPAREDAKTRPAPKGTPAKRAA